MVIDTGCGCWPRILQRSSPRDKQTQDVDLDEVDLEADDLDEDVLDGDELDEDDLDVERPPLERWLQLYVEEETIGEDSLWDGVIVAIALQKIDDWFSPLRSAKVLSTVVRIVDHPPE